ncbi:dehydrogenase [Arenibacter sp. H213]|nr:dehydrogenase [Arenibacter sp. H213]
MGLTRYFFLLLLIVSCSPSFDEPVVLLEDYTIEDGFALEVVASEPLLVAPVAMDFDDKGRIWVAEMPGFMRNLEGTGEALRTGSIKILEDLDRDGVMDHAKPFLDSLVMPRALALVYGGLLYVESPNLWYVEIENDKPKNKVLVDSLYATVGNPEHQPNGLMMNVDNWIYNAKSNFRYQRKNGVWKKEPTTLRGQWGISHDNFGRLYYNNNSTQLMGDHVLPNRLVRNKFMVPKYGVDQVLTKDQRVYPLHAASVNRGYEKGVLDQDSLLTRVTAACGPLVYRGGMFPDDYDQNVFVCIPEINAIKRNIISFKDGLVEANQAWQGKEFLASTDEGFRPVNLSNGPDGNMYVVDMHRGVIQHYAFLSPYLKKISAQKQLDTIVDYGRILRIKNSNVPEREAIDLSVLSGKELVTALLDSNGWIRDRAQQLLIHKGKLEVVPEIQKLAIDSNNPLGQIHALYVLHGLDALTFNFLYKVVQDSSAEVVAHGLVLMENFVEKENLSKAHDIFKKLLGRNEGMIDLYLSSTIGVWADLDQELFFPVVYQLVQNYHDNEIVQEAIVSGAESILEPLDIYLKKRRDNENSGELTLLATSIDRKNNDKPNFIFSQKIAKADSRTNGATLFRQICASCHSPSGEGITGLAPSLVGSEYISTHLEQLGLIMLHGLKGPLLIHGELYDLDHQMPGLMNNRDISDQDIADIISYITNAFSNRSRSLKAAKIKSLRDQKSKSGMEYTEAELKELIQPAP